MKFDKFLGLYTAGGRNSRPLGSMDACDNFVLNDKLYKPVLRKGYSTDLTAAPTDISGATALASFRYPSGTYPATEYPTAQNITVIAGTDGGSNPHFFQMPFWKHNAGTIDSTNWLKWGESFTTTISVVAGAGITMPASPAPSVTNNYYAGWIIHNSTRSEYSYIVSSNGAARTVGLYENAPSDWVATDDIILYRHFHDNPAFSPRWNEPIALKQGNALLVSGGQGDTEGQKPILSQVINKSWFSGSGLVPAYNQTYVGEAELKNSNSWINIQAIAQVSGQDPDGFSLTSKRYWFGVVWESFDGQRSLIYSPATAYFDPTTANDDAMSVQVRIQFPLMDKRAKWIHVFLAETSDTVSTSPEYDEWFWISENDLTGTGWTYTVPGAAPGYWSKTFQLNQNDWNNKQESLVDFLGHTKPNRTTVSFSYGVIAGGRTYVAKYYDYNAALSFNDQINFCPIAGNGVAQYNKLMDLDDQLQSTIEAGDPSIIRNITSDEGRLFIPKDRGIYWIDITREPEEWILNTVTKEIGCDAPFTVTVTPYGIIWAQSGNGIFLWRGGEPIEISRNLRPTFIALSSANVSVWWGWYDPFTRSYRMMYTADGSTKTIVYELHLDTLGKIPELDGLPIPVTHTVAHNIGQVITRSDGVVFFSTAAAATYKWDNSATDDAATQTRPYFKMGAYSPSEKDLMMLLGFDLSVTQTGTVEAARQLDLKPYVDGGAVTTYADVTAANSRFATDLPIVGRVGTTFDFEFNSNASRRGLGTAYQVHELALEYAVIERGGDVRQSL